MLLWGTVRKIHKIIKDAVLFALYIIVIFICIYFIVNELKHTILNRELDMCVNNIVENNSYYLFPRHKSTCEKIETETTISQSNSTQQEAF